MIKKLLLTITMMLPVAVLAQEIKPASESEKTLLNKSEIIDLIKQVGQMSPQQRNEKIKQLCATDADSKTPRSDFLYCSAFAYLDHYKAQACLARAFENGRGIIQSYTDAYVWYTLALEHPIEDAGIKEKIQAGQDHIKMMLFSVYPAPSDYELEDEVKTQKEKIEEYAVQ